MIAPTSKSKSLFSFPAMMLEEITVFGNAAKPANMPPPRSAGARLSVMVLLVIVTSSRNLIPPPLLFAGLPEIVLPVSVTG